jgi:hypothetical protein
MKNELHQLTNTSLSTKLLCQNSSNEHMQSDKVPAAREVEQGHECLHWVRSPS